MVANFGICRPFPKAILIQNFAFTIYRKGGKLRRRWQAEKRFWEVSILISLLLSSFGNSMYPKEVYSQVSSATCNIYPFHLNL